jgi:DNA mismatch repair protein MutS2
MEFDQSTLQPTYRFKPGVPGSSYALEMARRMSIDEDILRRSAELLGHRESRLESLLMELEAAAQQQKRDREHFAAERTRLETMVREYDGKIAGADREIRDRKNAALKEAEKIVENANALVERSVREIRESGAARETLRAVKADITEAREKIALEHVPVNEEGNPSLAEVAPGALVSLRSGGEPGRVESIIPEKGIAYVQFGSIRMKVNIPDLLPSQQKPRIAGSPPVPRAPDPGFSSNEIDIRGLTGDEAIEMVDKFIDSAILSGLHRIDIIHGKGTGALRKRVSGFLTDHPRVRSFRLGEWNEGGSGATVVELAD